VKKTRQNKKLKPGSDSIRTEQVLGGDGPDGAAANAGAFPAVPQASPGGSGAVDHRRELRR
jgi:hypothetical protein